MAAVRYIVADVERAIGFYRLEDPAGNVIELFEPARRAPQARAR